MEPLEFLDYIKTQLDSAVKRNNLVYCDWNPKDSPSTSEQKIHAPYWHVKTEKEGELEAKINRRVIVTDQNRAYPVYVEWSLHRSYSIPERIHEEVGPGLWSGTVTIIASELYDPNDNRYFESSLPYCSLFTDFISVQGEDQIRERADAFKAGKKVLNLSKDTPEVVIPAVFDVLPRMINREIYSHPNFR